MPNTMINADSNFKPPEQKNIPDPQSSINHNYHSNIASKPRYLSCLTSGKKAATLWRQNDRIFCSRSLNIYFEIPVFQNSVRFNETDPASSKTSQNSKKKLFSYHKKDKIICVIFSFNKLIIRLIE